MFQKKNRRIMTEERYAFSDRKVNLELRLWQPPVLKGMREVLADLSYSGRVSQIKKKNGVFLKRLMKTKR